MKPILLIDGDQYLFKATAALETEVRWDEENHVLFTNREAAWDNLTGMLGRLFTRFESREHALCFSTSPGFRLKIAEDYKGGRSPRKPLCYADLKQTLTEHYNVVSMPGLEADDVMGILATKPGKHKRVIISQDKDMKTIPSTVWNGVDLVTYSEIEADYWHLYQTLVGDTSDGFKGCPGMGPKKAEALLTNGAADKWRIVVAAFVKAELTEADALKQARLARILRWNDWDTNKKEPILWTPTQSLTGQSSS